MPEENKASYKCEFCGKSYSDILEYAKCVNTCATEAEKKAKEAERKRLADERETRISQIRAAENYLKQLYEAWYKDYGVYSSFTFSSVFPFIDSIFK